MLTLNSAFALSSKWTLNALVEWFGLEVGSVGGEIWHADVNTTWYATERFGISIGYNFYKLDFDARDADFSGLFNYTDQGPFLCMEFSF